ncbi:TPA: IS200/IS605 family transposase [Escherichia coli]|nr:IS200/IS605 family transposase [Escherichia coli]
MQRATALRRFVAFRLSIKRLNLIKKIALKYNIFRFPNGALFDSQMIAQLREAFGSAAAKLECEIIEMDGEPDHVHLLVAYPPKLAVSVMVNNLKSVSSRLLRQQNAHLRMQSKTGLLWSRSYFVCSTGGATIETLRAYIQSQSTPD